MTEPPIDMDRLKRDQKRNKPSGPRVLTPGRQHWLYRPLTIGGLMINDAVMILVGMTLGIWLW